MWMRRKYCAFSSARGAPAAPPAPGRVPASRSVSRSAISARCSGSRPCIRSSVCSRSSSTFSDLRHEPRHHQETLPPEAHVLIDRNGSRRARNHASLLNIMSRWSQTKLEITRDPTAVGCTSGWVSTPVRKGRESSRVSNHPYPTIPAAHPGNNRSKILGECGLRTESCTALLATNLDRRRLIEAPLTQFE